MAKILIFEDNPVNQVVTRKILEKAGHDVTVAENGVEGLGIFREDQFDFVFMDVQMPVMDGYEATKQIRNMGDERANVPIVALTANAMPEDRRRCMDAGMNEYIAKPFRPQDLYDMVAKFLG